MRILLCILISVMVIACAGKEQLPPQQKDVNLIKVMLTGEGNSQNEPMLISTPAQIEQIISFINSHSKGWKQPFSDTIEGDVYLTLYRDERFVGNFYVGDDFFGRDYGSPWVQDASQLEVTKFLAIVGIETNNLNISGRCSPAQMKTLNQLVMGQKLVSNTISKKAFVEFKSHYPNWCETQVSQQTYKIYTSDTSRNKIIVEQVKEDKDNGYFGPFKLSK